MVKLSINLRNKHIFFFASAVLFVTLIYHITQMSGSIDLTGMDRLLYFVLIMSSAACFWVPYQFNEHFT